MTKQRDLHMGKLFQQCDVEQSLRIEQQKTLFLQQQLIVVYCRQYVV
jgi:hypothetical protein